MNWTEGIFAYLPVLIAGTLIGAFVALVISWLAAGFTFAGEARRLAVITLGLAVLGTVAGVTGGMSREAAVGSIVPAALALVGGASLYVFGIEPSRGLVASIGAISFAVALGVGYAGGAGDRARGDVERNFVQFCRERLGDADLLASDHAYCRFQANFGETCAHYIAKEVVEDDVEQSSTYDRDAHYRDVYSALLVNLNRNLKASCSLPLTFYDRNSAAPSNRHRTFPMELPAVSVGNRQD